MQKVGHQPPLGNGRQQCKWAWPKLVQYQGSKQKKVGQAWFNAIPPNVGQLACMGWPA